MRTINQTLNGEMEETWKKLKEFFGDNISWKKVIDKGLKYYYRQLKKKVEDG